MGRLTGGCKVWFQKAAWKRPDRTSKKAKRPDFFTPPDSHRARREMTEAKTRRTKAGGAPNSPSPTPGGERNAREEVARDRNTKNSPAVRCFLKSHGGFTQGRRVRRYHLKSGHVWPNVFQERPDRETAINAGIKLSLTVWYVGRLRPSSRRPARRRAARFDRSAARSAQRVPKERSVMSVSCRLVA